MTAVTVLVGTRPEAIKMAPVIKELSLPKYGLSLHVCSTGQHKEMLQQALEMFGIVPHSNLNLMNPGADLASMSSAIMTGLNRHLQEQPADVILVHGDTTTAFLGALTGFYHGIPIGHVEAGLRTHNLQAPFPEELNRQLISRIARWHFAPTQKAKENLQSEGVASSAITVTGNTVIDALHLALSNIRGSEKLRTKVNNNLLKVLGFDWTKTRFILITGHRRENLKSGIQELSHAITKLAEDFPDTHFVYPVHLNPRVREQLARPLVAKSNIHLIEPLDYPEFITLLEHCFFVLTDSGGLQEEAPSLGKPVLVMREATERAEAVESGAAKLVDASSATIIAAASELLTDSGSYEAMSGIKNPFGDGQASARIAKTLVNEVSVES